jgi:hypothetical protein
MRNIYASLQKTIKIKKLSEKKYQISFPYTGIAKKFWANFPWTYFTILEKEDMDDERVVIVKAQSIQTLAQFLSHNKKKISYDAAFSLFADVGDFIRTLEKFNVAVLSIDIHNIIVLNDRHFLYMEDSNLYDIFNGEIVIKDPLKTKQYQKNKFAAPEIKKINTVRATIKSKSSYYNLGDLTFFCLSNEYLEEGGWGSHNPTLNHILHTKLFWAMGRCLEKRPRDRYYLII